MWLKYDSLIHNADMVNKLFLLFNSLVYNLKMQGNYHASNISGRLLEHTFSGG